MHVSVCTFEIPETRFSAHTHTHTHRSPAEAEYARTRRGNSVVCGCGGVSQHGVFPSNIYSMLLIARSAGAIGWGTEQTCRQVKE